MIQMIDCYHKTIAAKKLIKNHLVQQTQQHATQVGKLIGRFQTFCQKTTHVTNGCPVDYYHTFLFLLLQK